MSEDLSTVAKQSDFQWNKIRKEILKERYPNLWEEYKNE